MKAPEFAFARFNSSSKQEYMTESNLQSLSSKFA